MLTCIGKLNPESFAILDGQDSHVVLAPDLPTWDDNQSPQYRKSYRQPHRLLRLPDTNLFSVELQVGRGLPQIRVDLSHPVPSIVLPERPPAPIRAATWRIRWPEICRGTCACVGVSIHPNTPGSPVDRLLYWDLADCLHCRADTPAHGVLELKTLCRWRILQQLMAVIQSGKERDEFDIWSNVEQRVKSLPFPKTIRNQFRLVNFRRICGEVSRNM